PPRLHRGYERRLGQPEPHDLPRRQAAASAAGRPARAARVPLPQRSDRHDAWLMRDWWLRTLLVLQRPRPVFAALRDDTPEAAADRSEPVLLVVLLAGIATVLATSTAAHLNNDGSYSGVLIAIWAFFAGSVYGLFGYFAF